MSGEVFLYFFKSGKRIKIGISRKVQQRLATVGAHMNRSPKLIGSISGSFLLEKFIHSKLAEHRLRGEWFTDCKAVRDVIGTLISSGPEAIGFSGEVTLKKGRKPFVMPERTREDSLRARREVVELLFQPTPLRGLSEFLEQPEGQCKRWLDGTDIMPRVFCYAIGGYLMEYLSENMSRKRSQSR